MKRLLRYITYGFFDRNEKRILELERRSTCCRQYLEIKLVLVDSPRSRMTSLGCISHSHSTSYYKQTFKVLTLKVNFT